MVGTAIARLAEVAANYHRSQQPLPARAAPRLVTFKDEPVALPVVLKEAFR